MTNFLKNLLSAVVIVLGIVATAYIAVVIQSGMSSIQKDAPESRHMYCVCGVPREELTEKNLRGGLAAVEITLFAPGATDGYVSGWCACKDTDKENK